MAASSKNTRSADGSGNSSWAVKSKSEKSKKFEFLRELEHLSQKITSMEREKGTHLYNKRSDFRKEFVPLEEMEIKFNTERKSERTKLKQHLDKMRGTVARFQKDLQNVKPTPDFVERLKILMEDIESNMNIFKENQKIVYEELMREERICSQEVLAFEKRFESWSQITNIVPTKKITSNSTKKKIDSSTNQVTQNCPPEVTAFERFLQQNGGHRGGWDEYDHQTFLKIRGKFKGKPAFLDAAINELAIRSITDISQHEAWYKEFNKLLDEKKQAVEKWKTQKQADRDDLLNAVDDEKDHEEETRKQQAKLKRIEEERKTQKTKLDAWKTQKELERALQEEKKHEEQMKKEKEREKERMRQVQVKMKVESYLQNKQEEQQLLQQNLEEDIRKEREDAEKRRFAQIEIQRFQERDQTNMYKKIDKEKQKQIAAKERQERLHRLKETVAVNVERDPTRLYRMTKGWKERTKEPGPSGSAQVLHIPHRAVPSWRSGL